MNPVSTDTDPAAAPKLGKVYLIGAGPGAADLITVRGARLLAQADVVLYDALVTPDMLALCVQARCIPVGKRCGRSSTAQDHINQQLIDHARRSAIVVRLKGGDPMLFGRAEEELSALEAVGIESEIVPGITAALAGAAASRQPLTRRGIARSVGFFTSSTAPGEPDQPRLPECDTLIQYMGGREAQKTAQRLLASGMAPDMPVIIIENCSLPTQKIDYLTLASLEHGLNNRSGPVLVMIGPSLAPR